MKKALSLIALAILSFITLQAGDKGGKQWAITGFERPADTNPVMKPDTSSIFFCPMNSAPTKWEDSDTFNPAAVTLGNGIALLYRAEDNSATGIGSRTSRIGFAYSEDGLHFQRHPSPVLFPGGDEWEWIDCPGGCEDPRICVTEEGLYVMTYTSWNRQTPRLCIATSKDLVHWTKHGSAFTKESGIQDMASKSGSIVTRLKNGRLVIAKWHGQYLMYWGEEWVNLATSDDLIHWTPLKDENGGLLKIMQTREGRFDSALTECGPPALMTPKGIILFYNGKNLAGEKGDSNYAVGAYCGGQALFSLKDPKRLVDRLDAPYFYPEDAFEKSGQYPAGTVFTEGLAYLDGKWFLYYGCADSFVGVAVATAK